jgi:uncharacterized protein (TIGR03067 family)
MCVALALGWPLLIMAADKPDDDAKAIQGSWQMKHMEEEGEKAPPDQVKDFVFVFDGDKSSMNYQGSVSYEGKFKLDPSATPKQIDIILKEGTMQGIYKLDKDGLMICAPASKDNKTRPKEFATKAGSKTMLMVLERQKR